MKTKDLLAFIGLVAVWGTSFLWIKIGLQEIGPFTLVAFRILFGVIGLLLVVAIKKPAWPRDARTWIILSTIGIINVAVPFTLISWGEVYIDSAMASILNSSVPLFTVLIAHFFLKDDQLNWRKGFGILIGFLGVVVLVLKELQFGVQSNLLGQGAVLLAAVFYAISSVFIRKYSQGINNFIMALIPLIAADTLMWVLAPIVESPFTLPSLPLTWVALLWLGLLGSCVAYLLYYYLIHSIGPSKASMVTFAFPVVGVILGVSFLGESLNWYLILGSLLVILSLVIVNKKEKNNKARA